MCATSTAPEPRPWWQDLLQRLFFLLVVRPFLALFVGLRVRGREHLPAADPCLVIANHTSHLDAVTLLSLFPRARLARVQAVAAADYFERNRLVSLLTRTLFNTLPIARHGAARDGSAPDPREAMLAALRAGRSLVLFPEGTRGRSADPAPFKGGVAWLVERMPGLPVVPVYLQDLGRSLPKGELVPVPFFAEVRIGAPLRPTGDRAAILATLEEAVHRLRDEG